MTTPIRYSSGGGPPDSAGGTGRNGSWGESEHFELNLPLIRRGKVRDVYALPADADGAGRAGPAGGSSGKDPGSEDRIVLVATDRVSAFDVVMPTLIPGKGKLLTAISSFWLRFIEREGLSETHLVSTDASEVPRSAYPGGKEAERVRAWLEGRVTICRAASVIPIECVARGYLEGSGLKEYRETGRVCGVELPAGLRQCEKLPEAIFTPATKEQSGHDVNISFERACEIAGLETMGVMRDTTLRVYRRASEHAAARGIIIADTKFEFGFAAHASTRGSGVLNGGRVWTAPMLVDEALTPDSSRFWPADGYAPGRAQKSFDKQFLREYLESLVSAGRWNKQAPGPVLPEDVVKGTLERYREAAEWLCS